MNENLKKVMNVEIRKKAITGLQVFFRDVYSYLGTGLFLTGSIVYLIIKTGLVFSITDNVFGLVSLLSFALLMSISSRMDSMSVGEAQLHFWVLAVMKGVVLAPICYFYAESVLPSILMTAGVLVCMSIWSRVTSVDLSRITNILFGSLIGLLVISIFNLFMHNALVDTMICVAGIVLFTVMIAWDHQNLESLYYSGYSTHGESKEKLAVFGALQIYMDVINIFIYMLRLFSKKND